MLPPLHQLLRPRRCQRGQEVALGFPHVGQFVGAAIHPGGQARELGGAQGGGFGDGGAHYRDAQQVGLELHQQIIDAGAAVHAQL